MTQNSSQKFKVPAVPKVHHRKGVAKRVRAEPDSGNAYPLPQLLEIPVKVVNGDLRIVMCPVYVSGHATTEKAKKILAKLDREGYKSMLSAFSDDLENHVVEVYIFFRQSKDLTGPKTRVKNGKGDEVSTDEILRTGLIGHFDRFEIYKPGQPLFRKRR